MQYDKRGQADFNLNNQNWYVSVWSILQLLVSSSTRDYHVFFFHKVRQDFKKKSLKKKGTHYIRLSKRLMAGRNILNFLEV